MPPRPSCRISKLFTSATRASIPTTLHKLEKCSRNDEVQVGWRGEVPHCRVVDRRGLVRRHHIVELAALWGSSCSGELSISGQQPSTDSCLHGSGTRHQLRALAAGRGLLLTSLPTSSGMAARYALWRPVSARRRAFGCSQASTAAAVERRRHRGRRRPPGLCGAHIVCSALPAAPMDRSARSTDGDLAARARGEPLPRLECAVPPGGACSPGHDVRQRDRPNWCGWQGLSRHEARPAGTSTCHGAPIKGGRAIACLRNMSCCRSIVVKSSGSVQCRRPGGLRCARLWRPLARAGKLLVA